MAESTLYNGRSRSSSLVTRDLELRRRFLMQRHLPQDVEQFVISRILPAYQSKSDYLRTLAGLALMCNDPEQSFALLFCFSKLRRHALNYFINRLYIFICTCPFFYSCLIHLLILSLVHCLF